MPVYPGALDVRGFWVSMDSRHWVSMDSSAMGTLEKVLESLGWEKKRGSKQWLPPVQVHEETIKLPEFAFA